MAITIHDVAKEAGVSITTVSRVLNANYPVNVHTKQKVNDAIRKLGYHPNETARSLITKKTKRIGVLVPGISNIFFSQIVEHIERLFLQEGYSLMIHNTYGNPQRELSILGHLVQQSVEGVLLMDPCSENIIKRAYDDILTQTQLLLIGGICEQNPYDYIAFDERKGFTDALQYLFQLGHTRIAFVRGQNSYSYELKEEIYKKFLQDNGLTYNMVLRVERGNSLHVVKETQKAAINLLTGIDAPTAIFTCNELMASGIVRAIDILGLQIPRDLSLLSCDNTLLGEIIKPRLSTIDLRQEEVSEKAVYVLMSKIKKEATKEMQYTYSSSLVIRESCEKKRSN